MALVSGRELDDETQVRVDQPLLGGQIARLDPLCELHLLLPREQGVAARLAEEQPEAVGGLDWVVCVAPTEGRRDLVRTSRVLPARTTRIVALGLSAPAARHSSPF